MHFLPQKQLIKHSTLSACLLFSPVVLAACNSAAPATTPSSDFTVHSDGTVTHKTTGLMWKVCSEGQTWVGGVSVSTSCTGSIITYLWDAALQIPEALNAGGGFPLSGVGTPYNDWRLPNLKELQSIAELRCYSPGINENIFPSTVSFIYWSSSPDAINSSNAWGLHFSYGGNDYNYSRNSVQRVRLVRTGQ